MAKKMLVAAAVISAAFAAFHAAMGIIGPSAYRSFDAEDLARQSEAGSLRPALLMAGVTLLFGLFALYGLSGAQVFARVPLLRSVLLIVAILYVLIGLQIAPEILALTSGRDVVTREVAFHGAFLTAGILYLLGAIKSWQDLAPCSRRVA